MTTSVELQRVALKLVSIVIKKQVGVVMLTGNTYFKMHMIGGSTPRTSFKCNGLAYQHIIAYLHQILAVMTIKRGQSVHMTNLHAVAISCKGF